ncbi:hypothetical protein [Aeromonas jandaei]|uniref:hypothetical protein n=1 Tax=Aeromonas jandaei TaxID=650 RepID=UPI003D1EEF67
MQINSASMPIMRPDYGKYPSYPEVTPEQINQAQNKVLDKKDEVETQREDQATARRTMAVSYSAAQQNKAVVERYMEASDTESNDNSGPSASDVYQAANSYQRQQNLSDYLQFQQSPLGQQMGSMVGEEKPKGSLLDITA